jgi:hypothetical protein
MNWKQCGRKHLGLTFGTVMVLYLYPEDRGSKLLQNVGKLPSDSAQECLSKLKTEAVSPSETFAHFHQTA